jgi:hypothetical protein
MRALLVALTLMIGSQAVAEIIDSNFTFKGKNITVHMVDSADGGCWTNLREVREYAEEKLRMKGASVDDNWSDSSFLLFVQIMGSRNPNNSTQCVGAINIGVMDMSYYREKRYAMLSDWGMVHLTNGNLNNNVFDAVNKALAEFN